MTTPEQVETRLRQTLEDERRRLRADPSRLVLQAEQGARRIRQRRSAVGAAGVMVAVVVAIAALGALVRVPGTSDGRQVDPAASSARPSVTRVVEAPAPSVSPSPWWRDLPAVGTAPTDYAGQVEDVVLGNDHLYVLAVDEPARVDALDPGTEKVVWSRRLPVLPSPQAGGGLLRLDATSGVLWAYRADAQGQCRLDAVDAGSGGVAGGLAVPCEVTDLAAENGRVWAVYGSQLHVLRDGDSALRLVPDTDGAYALGMDRRRDRILVGLDGSRLLALDSRTAAVVASTAVTYGKLTIAWTPNDELWLAGYGGDTLRRLDPQSLARAGGSQVSESTGPGAQVWAGDTVVWVREGGGVGLACVNAADGTPLARWSSVQGPVVSTSGPPRAWAVNERALVRLDLPSDCGG